MGSLPLGHPGFMSYLAESAVAQRKFILPGNMRLYIHSMLSNLIVNQLVLPETVPKPPGTKELPGPGCKSLALIELSTGTRLNS